MKRKREYGVTIVSSCIVFQNRFGNWWSFNRIKRDNVNPAFPSNPADIIIFLQAGLSTNNQAAFGIQLKEIDASSITRIRCVKLCMSFS